MTSPDQLRANQPEVSHAELQYEKNRSLAVEYCTKLMALKSIIGVDIQSDTPRRAELLAKYHMINALIESVFQDTQGRGLLPLVTNDQLKTFVNETHTLLGLPTATILPFPNKEERTDRKAK